MQCTTQQSSRSDTKKNKTACRRAHNRPPVFSLPSFRRHHLHPPGLPQLKVVELRGTKRCRAVVRHGQVSAIKILTITLFFRDTPTAAAHARFHHQNKLKAGGERALGRPELQQRSKGPPAQLAKHTCLTIPSLPLQNKTWCTLTKDHIRPPYAQQLGRCRCAKNKNTKRRRTPLGRVDTRANGATKAMIDEYPFKRKENNKCAVR